MDTRYHPLEASDSLRVGSVSPLMFGMIRRGYRYVPLDDACAGQV